MWKAENDLQAIETRIAELTQSHADLPSDAVIAEPLRDIAAHVRDQAVTSSEGGKRLRALLALAAFDAANGKDDQRSSMLDVACAIEVFQTAALVHDDIIDDADLRRGKPSAHRALESATHSTTIGNGLGLMLGDILATASIDIVVDASRHLQHADALIDAFLTMQREVEIGQVLDLGVETADLNDPQALADASLNVFRWKTASYTTIAPLMLGMSAAGIDPKEARNHALTIGEPLGLAFQLADDLLDVTASSEHTGKPRGGDIREGKRTVLLADSLAQCSSHEREELVTMFTASTRSSNDVNRAIELFETSGGITQSRERISTLWNQARTAIETLPLPATSREHLTGVAMRFVPENLR